MRLRAGKKRLSRVPSQALLQALEDFKECVRDRHYIINMTTYHDPWWNRHRRFVACQVCLAGSSIAKRYVTNPRRIICPRNMPTGVMNMLRALDYFRIGRVDDALATLGISRPPGVRRFFRVAHYKNNKCRFHVDLKNLAAMLKSHGL